MNLLILKLIVLLILIILPFSLSDPKTTRDKHYVKDTLGPKHRRFTLAFPKDYTGNQPFPLVGALHYGGHGMPFYGELILRELIEPALIGLGAIITAPDCPGIDWIQSESDQFILDLISQIRNHYSIDSNKILITGYSLGGIGTWHLVEKFSEQFTTALVMAGEPPTEINTTNWKVPLYVIHGRDDELFPIVNTTKKVVKMENGHMDITYRILDGVSHFEVHKFLDPLQEAVHWVLNCWETQ
jgi:predicted peptidase